MSKLESFVTTAVHCSIFICPTDPGLTVAEIIEIGKRLKLEEGELKDAIRSAEQQGELEQFWGKPYLMPRRDPFLCEFHFREDPDFRNIEAFDFVRNQLQGIARTQGANRAQIERSVLVERGVAAGLGRIDMEASITVMILGEHCTEKDNVIKLASGRSSYPLASEQVNQSRDRPRRTSEIKQRVYPLVADVIARRSDGRSTSAEPLDAFADALDTLGYKPFRLWWTQTVAELRMLEVTTSPVSATVLSAALVEGALTFLARHARQLNVGPFKSPDFERDPRTWKIEDLVKSAATGGDAAVLDAGARTRADELIRTRQRIHAGRMLSEHPGGPPDLRPEEASDARRTTELIVRRVLNWLQKFPPTQS